MNLGIDLGTSRTVIYAPGEGILLDEPSVIAVNQNRKQSGDGTVAGTGTGTLQQARQFGKHARRISF